MMLRVIVSLTIALLEDWLLFTLFLNDCDSSACRWVKMRAGLKETVEEARRQFSSVDVDGVSCLVLYTAVG